MGAMIIAIFAMLLILNRQTGLLFEEFFVYLLPLPMAIYTALYDWKYGLMVFIGMVAFSFIFGGFTTIFYAVSASLIGLVFGTMVCRKVDPTKMLIIVMAFSAASSIISNVALASLFGYDFEMSITQMKTTLTAALDANGYGELGELYTMDLLKQLFVISMAIMGLVEGFIVYRLGLLIMKRLHIHVGRAIPLLEFYPPSITGILAMTAFIMGIYGMSKPGTSALYRNIAQGLWVTGFFYLAFFGILCVILFIKKYITQSRILVIVLTIFAYLFLSQILTFLGFGYITFGLHARLLEPRKPGAPQ
jgi:hypothetical protein